ncbi:hypothetical protein [Hymenobacter properus]|uniref:Uncharacterized protein n=1 Tax=Hymenobacter properus TaxID=2791026 RepID=A0A931BLG2_9BACT|nr:hypothetical protein [Hymenobacter properus]MBF9143542.1 hypothetical protein [Hymenobacter properus]MBR7722355.1 hypothetical protein [Microvirga sp. SRT04]
MTNLRTLAALLLALPLAAAAQTTPASKPSTTTTTTPAPATVPPGMQPQTEVTEDLDPATGKVIRRTTRTIYVPVGTAPSSTTSKTTTPATTTATEAPTTAATDAQVTTFLRKKTTVSTLTTTGLLDAYSRFMDRVHNDRQGWKAGDWATASAVLSRLNERYDQLRSNFSFDDKVNIRAQQAEYQALRTGRQISDSVSDKL